VDSGTSPSTNTINQGESEMTGRRAAVGLSLLCALLFSAFAAQSASALGTQAFTCASGSSGTGVGPLQFEDAHCDKSTTEPSKVKFVHKEISGTVEGRTHIHVSNKETKNATTEAISALLTTENFHGFAKVEITCNEVTSEGATGVNWLKNTEIGGVKQVEGEVKLHYANNGGDCVVTGVKNCTTATVTAAQAKFISVEPAAEEMGLKFEPVIAGGNFAEITLHGTCAIAGMAFPVRGSFTATSPAGPNGGGATLVVTPAMSNLTLGGVAVTTSQTTTTRMKTNETLESAIALTTK
jgi:hypothetical protein